MSKFKLSDFLQYFPEVDFPITLGSDTHHIFSRQNRPIPQVAINEYLTKIEPGKDEFTEYVACFRLPSTDEYHGIVFWQASLMEYKYVLVTFDRKGNFIDKRVIAGTKSNGITLLKRVATFDDEGLILVAEGEGSANAQQYNASESRTFHFEILQSGDILLMLNEN